ncbi:MAG TPA: hypothetical protein PLJ21_00795 [Pseudobdellovibrionaceae bacterium]|nr:hypothetical protein [Pseudobdellovibrionaceae bacterium]
MFFQRLALLILAFYAPSLMAMVTRQVAPIFFELTMVEHQIGVKTTGLYLYQQPKVIQALDLEILLLHPGLVEIVLGEHDSAKIRQNPRFLKMFGLNPSDPSLSMKLSRFYGIDLMNPEKWPQKMTQADSIDAISAIKRVNWIDRDWTRFLIEEYMKENNLSSALYSKLSQALYRLELVSDLINRKMLEETLYERFWLTYKNEVSYLFEFGHPFDLKGSLEKNWKGNTAAKTIALKYVSSAELKALVNQATHQSLVVQRYKQYTKNSPYYLMNPVRGNIRDLEIQSYLEHRNEIQKIIEKSQDQNPSKPIRRQSRPSKPSQANINPSMCTPIF